MSSFIFTGRNMESNYMQLIKKFLQQSPSLNQHFVQLLIRFLPMFPRQFKIFKPFLTFLLQQMSISLQQNKIVYLLKRTPMQSSSLNQHFLQLLIRFLPVFPRQFKILKPFLTFLLQQVSISLQQNKIVYFLKRTPVQFI